MADKKGSNMREIKIGKDLNIRNEIIANAKEQAQDLPPKINIMEFLQNLNSVINKENFIAHLNSTPDSKTRLAFLNLVQPTLENPSIKLKKGSRETRIKAYKDTSNNTIFYVLATKENGKILLTGIPTKKEAYLRNEIKKADKVEVSALSSLHLTGRGDKL